MTIYVGTWPSDDGLRGVLELSPVWDKLAIRLGVTIEQISANRRDNPHSPDVAALTSLQQWRDGKNTRYPATWEFLLGAVKEEKGINVADKLRGKIRMKKNWTQGVHMLCSCVCIEFHHGCQTFNLMLHSVCSYIDTEESESVDSGQPSSSVPGPVSRVQNNPPKNGEFQ